MDIVTEKVIWMDRQEPSMADKTRRSEEDPLVRPRPKTPDIIKSCSVAVRGDNEETASNQSEKISKSAPPLDESKNFKWISNAFRSRSSKKQTKRKQAKQDAKTTTHKSIELCQTVIYGDSGLDGEEENLAGHGLMGRDLLEVGQPTNKKLNIKLAVHVFMTLQDPYHAELQVIYRSLQQIPMLIREKRCLQYIERNQMHAAVIKCMEHLLKVPEIQQTGCHVLHKLMESSPTVHSALQETNLAQLIQNLMMEHLTQPSVEVAALEMLATLAVGPAGRQQMLYQGCDILGAVLEAMRSHSQHREVLLAACRAYSSLLADEPLWQNEMLQSGALPFLLAAYTKYSDQQSVIQQVCILFAVLAAECAHHNVLMDKNVHMIALDCLDKHRDIEAIVQACISILQHLCQKDAVLQCLLTRGTHVRLLNLSMMFPDSPKLQTSILTIFSLLAHHLVKLYASHEEEHWLRRLYEVMSKHRDDACLQEMACCALSRLVQLWPRLMEKVGEDSGRGDSGLDKSDNSKDVVFTPLKQYPMHTLCLGALLMHRRDGSVVLAVCAALYWMVADNEPLQTLLVRKNAFIAVFEAMKLHRNSELLQEKCCRLIRGMCIFSAQCKQIMAHYNALEELLYPLRNFPNNPDVQAEAIASIACLADEENGSVRNQCMWGQWPVHRQILQSMTQHKVHPLLQEAALETLSVLCAADGGPALLREVDALKVVLEVMEEHQENPEIMKKGLMLVQLLMDDNIEDDDVACLDLARLVCVTMVDNRLNHRIQMEGCVILYMMAEMGEEVSKVLVESGAHECLLYILENIPEPQELVNIASECLYLLCCQWHLKSSILLSLCAKGHHKGVECMLLLGADVNIGQGLDTPLSRACTRQDEYLVQLILEQGVSDIQTGLRQSLEIRNHQIVGMLLKHMGHDQEAGIVSWSGFKLGDLEPEWLYPTIEGQSPQPKAMSDEGKCLASKVDKAEEKRRMRKDSAWNISRQQPILTSRAKLMMRYAFRSHTQTVLDSMDQDRAEKPVFLGVEGMLRMRTTRGKSLSALKINLNPFARNNQGNLGTHAEKGQEAWNRRSSAPVPAGSVPCLSPGSPLRLCHFCQWPEELEDWKRNTLTGSNIPFSFSDPRRTEGQPLFQTPQSLPGKWERKSTSGDPCFVHGDELDNVTEIIQDSAYESASLPQRKYSRLHSLKENPWRRATSLASAPMGRRSSLTSKPILSPPQETFSLDSDSSDMPSIGEDSSTSAGRDSAPSCQPRQSRVRGRLQRSSTVGDLPLSMQRLKCVHLLDLSNNQISSVDRLLEAKASFLYRLENLDKLDLSHNSLTSVPDGLFIYLTSLQHLNLSFNSLTRFPALALGCKKLEILDLAHNQIADVTASMLAISRTVKEFHLSHNRLTQFPAWLATHLPHLDHFSISGNQLESLPEHPVSMKKLRTLHISHNYIRVLPEKFLADCQLLESLDMAWNKLECLPSEEAAARFPRLHTLIVEHNHLSAGEPFYLPKFILELQSLRTLDISNNSLIGLPAPSKWKTRHLRDLQLANNYVRKLSLTSEAKLWSTMERLNIGHNKLTEVPREIGYLSSLTSLDFSYNEQVTTIPDELGRLGRLWEMPLKGLKLDLDEGILRRRTKDLLGYLHEKLKKSVEYYHMKMMLVGYGGRGKSSLLRALTKQRQPEQSVATVGILLKDWKFNGWRGRRGKLVTYTLSTWDFAGQEEFYSTHQCFLSNRALYLVVYNLNLGESEIDTLTPWLLNIQARAPGCPVIVVGTHRDKVPKDRREEVVRVMREKIAKLCERPGFPDIEGRMIEVNGTSENVGINKLRVLIKDTLDNFKMKGQYVMGQKIPASYVRLQELLSEEARNLRCSLPVIRHKRLLKIIRDTDLDLDEDELQQAVRFLHESGVVLHYEDAALQLKDLYFVDPQWLCRMMAQVVTVKEVNPFINDKGILRKADMKQLFTGSRVSEDTSYSFPTNLIPQYLRMLEKFEIALPQNDEELLIPCRLPQRKPNIKLPQSNKHERVYRQYEMQYIPLGFWSRLITRLLVFAKSMLTEKDTFRKKPLQTTYWRKGIHVLYMQEAYFLVEQLHYRSMEVISVVVPATRAGGRLLGHVVDHIDTLIDEWYPGLTETNPLGDCVLQRKVPCNKCSGKDAHSFSLEELISQSELDDVITCPNNEEVSIRMLAPDVVLGDLEPKFRLQLSLLSLVQSPENQLGDGSFGTVFRAKYKNQSVAVKMYNNLGDVHPYKLMRQEATILRRLNHPSLVSMVGVGLHPRVLVLELAPLGSLGSLLKTGRTLSRGLQHKIAMQVADGLSYLHACMVVYRDLKPDNVLIFSLNMSATMNAKIADYGISRFATLCGLSQSEGTPGYRAPEVARGEAYTFQADVYSFGVLLYELITGGRHPFEDLDFRNELDEAVVKGRPLDPITNHGSAPWPDMEDLIEQCVQQIPEARPKSTEVFNSLSSVELLCLKRLIAVSKDLTVESMAVRTYGENEVEVWMASGDKDSAQLAWVNLTQDQQEPQGMMFKDRTRILCMAVVGQSSMLVGSQSGRIWVYDTWKHCCRHYLNKLPDAVLCLLHHSGFSCDYVFAGLANGQLAYYDTNGLLVDEDVVPRLIGVGKSDEPVRCMSMSGGRLYIGCGTRVVVVKVEPLVTMDTTMHVGSVRPGLVSNIAVQGRTIFLSKKGYSAVEMWQLNKKYPGHWVNIDAVIKTKTGMGQAEDREDEATYMVRVTSLLLQKNSILWVGTASGHIVVLDTNTRQPLTVIYRHNSSIRCMGMIQSYEFSPSMYSAILVGGTGFHNKTYDTKYEDGDYGFLSVWDTDIGEHARRLEMEAKKRLEQQNQQNADIVRRSSLDVLDASDKEDSDELNGYSSS